MTESPTASDPGSRAFLESRGFTGFVANGQLHAERAGRVPDATGVYALVRESHAPAEFLPRSTAPAWRGEDPTRPVDDLAQRWVMGAQLLYVGVAPGAGVRARLQQRIKRLLRFGHGRVVAHWGGRRVWQLRDHAVVRVAWWPCDDPRAEARRLVDAFVQAYGAPPFANDPGESDDADDA